MIDEIYFNVYLRFKFYSALYYAFQNISLLEIGLMIVC